jgi:hypothetical protein
MEILTDYETGRLIALIEWVSRGGKPIADCASRYLDPEQLVALRHDLEQAIVLSGERSVSAYILPHTVDPNLYEYGVFVFDWALEARIHLEKHECPDWYQGIVFGYSPVAIQSFKASPREPESKLQLCDDPGMVEIVRQC